MELSLVQIIYLLIHPPIWMPVWQRALLYFTEREIYVVNATNVFCKAFLLSPNNMLSVASYIDALCLFFVTNLELIVGLIVFANPLIDGFIKTDAPNASLAKYVSP